MRRTWSRLQFGFTITYHYLFPQLTMGLALLLVIIRRSRSARATPRWDELARFWARIFAHHLRRRRRHRHPAGVPVRYQLGAVLRPRGRRRRSHAGAWRAVRLLRRIRVPRPLPLRREEARPAAPLLRGLHGLRSARGSPATSSSSRTRSCSTRSATRWTRTAASSSRASGRYLFNAWAFWEYAHTMTAAVITGAFVVSAVAAYWTLMGRYERHARAALRLGVVAGFVACALQLFPTGDQQGKLVADYQPADARRDGGKVREQRRTPTSRSSGSRTWTSGASRIPSSCPRRSASSPTARSGRPSRAWTTFPRDQWPDNVELLYFAYHIMVGLGTLLFALLRSRRLLLWRGTLLERARCSGCSCSRFPSRTSRRRPAG